MAYVLGAFVVSLIVTLLLVRYRRLHVAFSGDTDFEGVQKFHTKAVPRVGGIALLIGMGVTTLIAAFRDPEVVTAVGLLVLASLPVFLGGLADDITKKVRARVRLSLALISGALAYYWLGADVTHLDIIGIDWLLQFGVVSFLFTIFAIAGSANAINIIDGYNGLASVVSAMILGWVGRLESV